MKYFRDLKASSIFWNRIYFYIILYLYYFYFLFLFLLQLENNIHSETLLFIKKNVYYMMILSKLYNFCIL